LNSYIIDIDGTLLDGNTEINSSKLFIEYLQKTGIDFLLATNSIKPHDKQVERLKEIGIKVSQKKIYNPIDSINKYIKRNKICNVHVVGSKDEISQIKAIQNTKSPELIILLDFEKNNFSYRDLQIIVDYVNNGSSIITASKSLFYLNKNKKQIDTGSFVNLIQSITGVSIPVLGKPSKEYFYNAQSILNSPINSTIVIGDDWKTDIIGANEVGFGSILIRSGKYMLGDEKKGNPDHIINNLLDIGMSPID